MTAPAISVRGLGKRYSLKRRKAFQRTLRESLISTAASPYRWLAGRASGKQDGGGRSEDEVWALRDVTLEIAEGTVVGIVGRNGAGKSTLLKVLSRITYPTSGWADVTGRLGSLLEVGTGFHQELTGRENVFLNGAILGMGRREIERKLDRIVEFSGVARFLDTPLKFYSTGMYLRLAFSVAAHLETDVLLVDEVLAVGDAEFQKKCLRKMGELAHEGRTVLFVSHNMPAVVHLCEKGVLLDQGRVVCQGPIDETVAEYGRLMSDPDEDEGAEQRGGVHVSPLQLEAGSGALRPGDPWPLLFRVKVKEPFEHILLQLGVTTHDGRSLVLDMIDSEKWPGLTQPGSYDVRVQVPPLWLQPQTYTARVKVYADKDLDRTARYFSDWLPLNIESASSHDVRSPALLTPMCEWNVEQADKAEA